MEQNNPHQNQTFMSIRELTISGLLAGITIFLGLTGYGFVPLVVMNATILHIPTIIGTECTYTEATPRSGCRSAARYR